MDLKKTGEFIADLRRGRGFTQQELANRLHVTYKAVSRWETGRGMPDIDNLEALSRELETSVTELLHGERIEGPLVQVQTEQIVQSSLSLFQQLLRRNDVYRAVLGFISGIVVILLVFIYLTSPITIPYYYGLIRVTVLSDDSILAICSDETASIDVSAADDGTVFLSCTNTRWNQLTKHDGRNTALVGNVQSTAAILYYPGMLDYSSPRGDVALYGTVYGNVITLPKLTFSILLTVCCVLSIVGLAIFAALIKRWYSVWVLRATLIPVCFTVSIIAVLWGKFDKVYHIGYYLSVICIMATALYAIAMEVMLQTERAASNDGGGFGAFPHARTLAFSLCIAIVATVVSIQIDTANRYRYLQDIGLDNLEYSVNEAGRTYGSGSGRDIEEQPDLVLVEGNDGVVGYVYTDDLWGKEPSSIEEALEGNSELPRDIPVYESDGVTVIGTFTIGAGKPS